MTIVYLYILFLKYIILFDKYGERVDCIFFPLLDNYSIRTSMKKNLCKRNSSYRLVVKVEFVEPSCRLRLSTSCNTSRTRRSQTPESRDKPLYNSCLITRCEIQAFFNIYIFLTNPLLTIALDLECMAPKLPK